MENKNYISAEEALFKVNYAALGQEVYSGDEAEGAEKFTPKEMARLWSFEHMIRQSNEVEERLNNNTPQEMWWVVKNDQGTVTDRRLLWKESWHMVETIRNTAFCMYTGHDLDTPEGLVRVPGFIDEPHMKEAADQLLHGIHQEKLDAVEFEKAELDHMMELP